MDPCPIHDGRLLPCWECELDAAESDPVRVKPIDPVTGRRLRHIPLRDLVAREKQRLGSRSDTPQREMHHA